MGRWTLGEERGRDESGRRGEEKLTVKHSVLRRARKAEPSALRAAELPKGTAQPIFERRLHVPFSRCLATSRVTGRKAWKHRGRARQKSS